MDGTFGGGDLISASLAIMLGGGGGIAPPTPITLDYILTNGIPVFATPKNPADGTVLENTLSDYTINLYIVKHEESVSNISHIEWSISPNPTEYRDTYISNLSYPYQVYCVYYYDDEAVCAQEVGIYQSPPRGQKTYTNFKWGTPISEYFEPSPHYTDWDYEICISSEWELATSEFSSNRYYFYVNTINTNGYIDLILKDTQYPTSSYAKFLYNQKTYTYLLDPPPPVLTNVNITTFEEDTYIRVYFPGIFQYQNSYEFIRKDGMTLAEQNDFLKEIAAKIHQYYQS